MSLLLSCQSLSKALGSRTLFRDLSLSIFASDRIGLIGPNGSGKSTLLKILVGQENPNEGIVSARKGLRVGYVPQTCDFPDISPKNVLLDAIKDLEMPDYEKEVVVDTWLSKLGFTGNEPSAALLSGGWKKRLAIAKELLFDPELLLLDEPTNHLDLEGILWLEKFLSREAPTYLLVSHDRYFLQNATNRIIELDPTYPGGSLSIDGSYSFFLERKAEFLEGQLQRERALASKARKETEWLRASPKARTTKAQSRIDGANEVLDELADVQKRNRQRIADIDFVASERETRKLIVGKNLSKSMGGRVLFSHLDITLAPGSRIGLMGPNGSGKTTLLKLLNAELEQDQGSLKRADALKIVYFDQHRTRLPGNLTLKQALSPNGDYVTFRGHPVHINGWCKRFLFSPTILDMPLERLSGGERARISIAHLMLQPADILLLDEPTNDLDIPTLETLEESLLEFGGAVVLITHDRCMLDRICNSVLALGDPEKTIEFADYAQWEKSLKPVVQTTNKEKSGEKPKKDNKPAKLSYAEKREFDQIEGTVAKLEEEVRKLNQLLESAEVAQSPQRLQEICTSIGLAETQIEQLYLRWDELDKKNNQGN
ncbi:MAG: ABC-F family ATP-binding cassette domain-containing protein [Chlamydiales bacterium]|nr:ABC-F family ATP-binding cassette domain-containing protein [Chlamydiales bacterium]